MKIYIYSVFHFVSSSFYSSSDLWWSWMRNPGDHLVTLPHSLQICKHVVVKDSKTMVLDLRWQGNWGRETHHAVNVNVTVTASSFFQKPAGPIFISVYMKAFVFIYFELKYCGFASSFFISLPSWMLRKSFDDDVLTVLCYFILFGFIFGVFKCRGTLLRTRLGA